MKLKRRTPVVVRKAVLKIGRRSQTDVHRNKGRYGSGRKMFSTCPRIGLCLVKHSRTRADFINGRFNQIKKADLMNENKGENPQYTGRGWNLPRGDEAAAAETSRKLRKKKWAPLFSTFFEKLHKVVLLEIWLVRELPDKVRCSHCSSDGREIKFSVVHQACEIICFVLHHRSAAPNALIEWSSSYFSN